MKNKLYSDLGVPVDATQDAIKKAYRKKVQKAHPDKGGSVEQFRLCQLAYETLSDNARKARYDQTGRIDQQTVDPDQQAKAEMVALLMECIGNFDIAKGSLVASMNCVLDRRFKDILNNVARLNLEIVRLQSIVQRTTIREGCENILVNAMNSLIDRYRKQVGQLNDAEALFEDVKVLLLDYAYKTDPKREEDILREEAFKDAAKKDKHFYLLPTA